MKKAPPKTAEKPAPKRGKRGPSHIVPAEKQEPLATLGQVAAAKPAAAPEVPKLDTTAPAEDGATQKKKGRPNGQAEAPAPVRSVPFSERPTALHYLPVRLDKDALNIRSEQHVALLDEIDRKREERRKAVASHTAIIKDLQAKADKMRDTLRTGQEEQPVECREVPDWQLKIVRLIRQDTDYMVSRRPMVEGELQIALSFPPEVAKGKLKQIAEAACTCDPKQPGVNRLDCPTHGAKDATPAPAPTKEA